MSSQESVGESRVSHPTPGPRANSDADYFEPSTEEEMEADLKRIDAMEEDHEVTSRLQARFMMEELQSSVIPNSVIPPNARFLSYENIKKTVTCSPAAMQHPWVKEALAVVCKLRKETMDLKQQVNKLEEENHILRGIIAKNITSLPPKRDINIWVWALPLATSKIGGGAPVSYHHHTLIFMFF